MPDPAALCEDILQELVSRPSGWEQLSPLECQLIVLVSYFVQARPSAEQFQAQLEEYMRGEQGALLAHAARELLLQYQSRQVA